MSLQSEVMSKSYAGNGSTTAFSFPYYFLDGTDLDVYLVDQAGTVLGTPGAEFLQTYITQYSVSSSGSDFSSGGTVTFVTPPAVGYTVVIIRDNPETQDTSFTNNSAYQSSVVEKALDKIVMMIQFLDFRSNRSLRMTDGNTQTFNTALPNPITANSSICVDPTGTSLIMGPSVSTINSAIINATAAAASASASAASASASATSASQAAVSTTYLGTGAIGDTSFTIVNNQVAPANVTGLLLDGTKVRSAEIDVHFYRNSTGGGATEMSARCKFIATYKTVAGAWDLASQGGGGDAEASTGSPAGVTLSITAAGQVQYISTNMTGTPASSVLHFRANTMGV